MDEKLYSIYLSNMQNLVFGPFLDPFQNKILFNAQYFLKIGWKIITFKFWKLVLSASFGSVYLAQGSETIKDRGKPSTYYWKLSTQSIQQKYFDLIWFIVCNATFSNIMETSFSGGRSRRTQRGTTDKLYHLWLRVECTFFFVIYKAGHEPTLY